MKLKRKDPRPDQYMYWNQLMKHLNGNTECFFNRELIWPRQFEIHLPSNHIKSCNLGCPHCAGRLFDKTLGTWEMEGLELLDKLRGKIPYHIYGGAYTEPLMNPYFMAYLNMTKKHDNHFGIHTNGTHLWSLENTTGWLTELNRIATDDTDYLSISIDAGTATNWGKTKGTKNTELFYDMLKGIEFACNLREKKGKTHAIRLCYLISPHSGTEADFSSIIHFAKRVKVDSLRFSIPFGVYNQTFKTIREYKKNTEIPGDQKYWNMLKGKVSESKDERPYIFYTGPEFTDVDKFENITHCAYFAYQITYGADGYVYKCSTVATPTGKQCRIGKISADIKEFKKMIMRNADLSFDCQKICFAKGLRGNRMALEINTMVSQIMEKRTR